MPNTYVDPLELIIPTYDASAQTSHLIVDVHPGQVRILEYLADSDRLPFRSHKDVARFCICFGTHALMGPLPNLFALVEAKMNIVRDERFQSQRDILAESVQKYLARGEHEVARRIVVLAQEEYRQISVPYWRELWLSALQPAIEMFKARGIRIPNSGPTSV
jgi:hypothetical protein